MLSGLKKYPSVRSGSTDGLGGVQGLGLHCLGTGLSGVRGGRGTMSLAITGYSFRVIETSAAAIPLPLGVSLVAVIDKSAITH